MNWSEMEELISYDALNLNRTHAQSVGPLTQLPSPAVKLNTNANCLIYYRIIILSWDLGNRNVNV